MVGSVQAAKRKKPRRPRAPLPRQHGGAHEDKTKRPHRQRKHRKRERDGDLHPVADDDRTVARARSLGSRVHPEGE